MDQPINILIVDDEPKNLNVLETILNDPAYRLVRAETADQALLALVVEDFALLILDIRMPDMTGFELAHMIKERKKTASVPIIFLTAYYNEDQHVLEGYDTGAVDYLHKPVNPAVLRSKVSVFAELYRRQRESSISNRALLAEMTERRRAEAQLRELNEQLEQRVMERTHALRASEERLRAIYDGTHEYMGLLSPDGTLLEVNRAALEFAGKTIEEVVGAPFWEGVWFQYTPGVPETIHAAVDRAAGGEFVRFETPINTPAGETKTFDVSLRPIFDEDGKVILIVPVGIDITDRKRMEQTLKEADRRKDEFLATLAHELRNPLAPIRNAVQLLHMNGATNPESQWARDIIDRQAQQMTRLIDDLLDISRITRDKIDLRREFVELSSVVQGAVEASRSLIDQNGHDLTVALPSESIILNADLTRLTQVFMNLLNNAAKYSEKRSRIVLAAERQGSDVLVSVKDTGIGIATADLHTIFEMFAQVEGPLTKAQGGLGIGLFLVKRLIQMHGGNIEAKSEGPGQGSEFVVRLPIAIPQSYARTPTSADAERPTPTSQFRILVVDDNRDAASTLTLLLKMMGNAVRVAHDGEEAVEAAKEYRPEVILLDIGLPKMNGYDAARAIRKEPWGQNIALIAVTGWGQDEDRRKSEQAGFDRHMVKPVDPLSLMKMLAELHFVKA